MRTFFILLGSLLVAALLAVGTLPWWWGGVLRAVGSRQGATFEAYSRVGYTRWALTGVRWEGAAGVARADRIEVPHPLLWWWQGAAAPKVEVRGWSWTASETRRAATESPPEGWRSRWERLAKIMPWPRRWLPAWELTDGEIGFAREQVVIGRITGAPGAGKVEAENITWRDRTARIELEWDSDQGERLVGRLVTEKEGSAEFWLDRTGGSFDAQWRAQPWQARVEFGALGWEPLSAVVKGDGWELPGTTWGWGDAVATIKGGFEVRWNDGVLSVRIDAAGTPPPERDAPAVTVKLRADGDRTKLSVHELVFDLPGMQAALDAPVTWSSEGDGKSLPTTAAFLVAGDLAEFTAGELNGEITGHAQVEVQASGWPRVVADFQGHGLQWADWPEAEVNAQVNFSEANIDVRRLELAAADGSTLTATGRWSLRDRTAADVRLRGRASRVWWGDRLPAEVDFSAIEFEADVEGAWPWLRHRGEVRVEKLQAAPWRVTAWSASWQGEGRAPIDWELTGTSARGKITAAGVLAEQSLTLKQAAWQRADGDTMNLVGPSTFAWGETWRVDNLTGRGPDDGLSLNFDANGRWRLQVDRLEQAWIDDWIDLPGPTWFVERADIDGVVTAAGWRGQADVRAAFSLGPQRSAQVYFDTRWEEDVVTLDRGEFSEGGRPILTMTGRLPVNFEPRNPDDPWRIAPGAPLALSVNSASNPAFWEQLRAATGIELVDPKVAVEIAGTWAKPQGTITLEAARLKSDPTRWDARWPEVTQLTARLVGGGDGLELETLRARVAGQELTASGRLPLDRECLGTLRDDPVAYLQTAGAGRIEIPDADLAAWSELAPDVLAPTGRFSLSLEVKPGAELRGSLQLVDAATRPLGPLGALQDITANLSFIGRRVTIDEVTAQTGGRPVVLKGEGTWPREGGLRVDLSLSGQNLPLVRDTGLLLRADVELTVKTESDDITWVRGGVKLREGLFLVDLQSLRPGPGGRSVGANRRPPYFSVEAQPFADWRLDVAVSGNRFMRIETPVFSGWASADFRLDGTLRSPRAVGEATLPSGRVKLPFANFDVGEGWVRLTEAEPYAPRLALTGTARRLGYDLRMELSGLASQPRLEFFSSPPLASEQVLLLVMAGEAPQDEVNYSSGQRATKLGAYLGQSLYHQFTGAAGGEDRLSISTGENVSREGRETYRVEYDVGPRWSLVGEYDEFDDFNAGLKWKVFSAAGKEADEKR